jgi:adenylate kinase
MDKNYVLTFVVGVSGVGKTQMIKRFVAEHQQYIHLEASKLIKQAINAQTSEQLRLLPREQILNNQYSLIQELAKYKQQHHRIILDGHLLINNGQEVVPVPLDIVKKIAPYNIILIQGDSRDIFLHCIKDCKKKRSEKKIFEINREQQYTKKIATNYSIKLGIKFNTIHFSDYTEFKKLLEDNL